jgi:hypothetical protein
MAAAVTAEDGQGHGQGQSEEMVLKEETAAAVGLTGDTLAAEKKAKKRKNEEVEREGKKHLIT